MGRKRPRDGPSSAPSSKGSSDARPLRAKHGGGVSVSGPCEAFHSSSGQYWLLKSEPEDNFTEIDGRRVNLAYSIDAMQKDATCEWDGVRNREANKHLKAMKAGDYAFFYHSSCKRKENGPGLVGIVQVSKEATVDRSQFDRSSPYFDEKVTEEKPVWHVVHVDYVARLDRMVSLAELKEKHAAGQPELGNMVLLRRARLSVQPVTVAEWDYLLQLAKEPRP